MALESHLGAKIFAWVIRQSIEIWSIRWYSTIQSNFREKEGVQLYVRIAWVVLAACMTQTIVAHAISRGIKLDRIDISVEGDIDLRGFSGLSRNIRPGAQQFRVNIKINSDTASNEQIDGLYEIGKKFSPAFDTLT